MGAIHKHKGRPPGEGEKVRSAESLHELQVTNNTHGEDGEKKLLKKPGPTWGPVQAETQSSEDEKTRSQAEEAAEGGGEGKPDQRVHTNPNQKRGVS